MADNLSEAREFRENYLHRSNLDLELVQIQFAADFAAQRIAAREGEIADELRKLPTYLTPGVSPQRALDRYIATLQGAGEKV